jgi:hypothetical protein
MHGNITNERKKMSFNIILAHWLNNVESMLKEKHKWLGESDRRQAANEAMHTFNDKDYDDEDSATLDVINTKECMSDFNLNVSFKGGKLFVDMAVDYLDGSNKETYDVDSVDDIMEKIQDVIESHIFESRD